MRIPTLIALLSLASSLPLHALDIAGYVLDKAGGPIAGAKVCVKSDAGSCVNTGAQGDFHLTKALAVRKAPTGRSGYDMAYRKGTLLVFSPGAARARLEWLSADGRKAWAVSGLALSAGANPVPLPAGLPHAGVCLLRLSAPGQTLAWKAVLAPGASSPGTAAAVSPRISSLAKAAAAPALEISKAGYRTRTYEPVSETVTDAYIFLSLTTDVGLVFGGTVSQKVVAIDRDKRTISTQSVDAYCGSTGDQTVIRDTLTSTHRYSIGDGKLWIWTDKECVGQEFTGAGTDIVGDWTLIEPTALLPQDLRAGCVQDSSVSEESPFETFSAEYKVSETQLTGTVTAETCPGDFLGSLFALLLFAGDSTVTTTKNTCVQVAFKNGKGQSAAFDFSKKGDTLVTAFGFNSATCRMGMDFGLSDKDPVCPEGGELEPFLDCVSASGFAGTGPLAKTSAAPARPALSLERRPAPAAIRPAVRGWLPSTRGTALRGEYISGVWKPIRPGK